MKKQVLTFLSATIVAMATFNTFCMETGYQLIAQTNQINEETGRPLIELNPNSFGELKKEYNEKKEQVFSELIKHNSLTKDSLVDIKITFPTNEELKVTSLVSNDMFSFEDISKVNAKLDLRIQDLKNTFEIMQKSMVAFEYNKNNLNAMQRQLIDISDQTTKLLKTIKDNEKKQKQKLVQLTNELKEFIKENNAQ